MEPDRDKATAERMMAGQEAHRPPDFVPDGWQGTQPAEGTRRKLILDKIVEAINEMDSFAGKTSELAQTLADEIESALLKAHGHRGCAECEGGSVSIVEPKLASEIGKSAAQVDRERWCGFCVRQRDSHNALRTSDVDYAEYHRGAEYAYTILLERLQSGDTALRTPAEHDTRTRIERLEAERDELAAECKAADDRAAEALIRVDEEKARIEERRNESVEAHHLLDAMGVPKGPEISPPTVLNRLRELHGDRRYARRDDEWVTEVAFQAAGAATRPLLEDHPDYVFPSERVSECVAELLRDFDIEVPDPARLSDEPAPTETVYDRVVRAVEAGPEDVEDVVAAEAAKALNHLVIARERLEETTASPIERDRLNHAITAAHMVVEPPALLSKEEELREAPSSKVQRVIDSLEDDDELTVDEKRLYSEREEARAGESRFAEERDCAFALLRWLLPVTVAKRLDSIGEGD